MALNESKMYTLRDEDGKMKAKVSEEVAQTLVLRSDGAWRPYQAKGQSPTRAFVFADDYCLGARLPYGSEGNTRAGDGALYIWKGDILVEPV